MKPPSAIDRRDAGVEIRALATRDSLAVLTGLLHRAYAPLAAQGLNMTAATQTEEQTRQRTLSGQTFVAVRERRIVGTITVSSPLDLTPGSLADMIEPYRHPSVCRFHQFAIDPDGCGAGIGGALVRQAEEWAMARGYLALAIDTPQTATTLRDFYQHMGYQESASVQLPGKNYVSVVLKKSLERSPLRRHLQTLARYNLWAVERLERAVAVLDDEAYRRPLGLPFGSIHGTLNHLLVGEHLVWWPRIAEGRAPQLALDAQAEPDRAALARRLREGAARWPALIESWAHDRLHGPLHYRRLSSETVMLPLAETMSHVFNHGTHHRGQISAALTTLGQPAPVLDMVVMLQQEANSA